MFDLGEVASRVSNTFQALPSFKGPTPFGQFDAAPGPAFNNFPIPGGTGPSLPAPGPAYGMGGFGALGGPRNFLPLPGPSFSLPWSSPKLNADGTQNGQASALPTTFGAGRGQSPQNGAVTTGHSTAGSPSSLTGQGDPSVLAHSEHINNASQSTGTPADVIAAIMETESHGDPNALSPMNYANGQAIGRARGLMQLMPGTGVGYGVNDNNWNDPASNIMGGAQYLRSLYDKYGDWNKAAVAYFTGHWDENALNLRDATGSSGQDYLDRFISQRSKYTTQSQAGNLIASVKGADLTPNQFTHPGEDLSPAEAAAACGPAAAVALSRALGRNPTLREAIDSAKSVGWTPAGMGGIYNESKLLDSFNIAHDIVGDTAGNLDESRIQSEVSRGKPVVVSGPDHYMTITDYNPATGQYYTGTSGSVSTQRSASMTYQQLKQAAGGSFNGAVFLK